MENFHQPGCSPLELEGQVMLMLSSSGHTGMRAERGIAASCCAQFVWECWNHIPSFEGLLLHPTPITRPRCHRCWCHLC